ncbi:hypothetical protein HHK36_010555 [Tetracentron sinense]|uniref:Uncharacterized protein n=1 Tax=Tetracentron sinense TaxID=13715 RepID=A0A834Z8T2_TETSI|nr:hypothetical protein HHK36_010555 [Tetracentron sinense]
MTMTMAASISSFSPHKPSISLRPIQTHTHRILAGLSVGTPESSRKLKHRLSLKQQRVDARGGVASEGSQGSELESEMNSEEWMELVGQRENCKGRRGLAEVLECLEEEAIMGEDNGRDATDYNRRARIFDKSSKVFQFVVVRNEIRGHGQ